jgi:hypothetical protein
VDRPLAPVLPELQRREDLEVLERLQFEAQGFVHLVVLLRQTPLPGLLVASRQLGVVVWGGRGLVEEQ